MNGFSICVVSFLQIAWGPQNTSQIKEKPLTKQKKVFSRVHLFSCVGIIQPVLAAVYSLFPWMLYKSALQTVVAEVYLVAHEEILELFS